jgi:hypothetical protein
MKNNEVPIALVRTWIELARNKGVEKEVKERALKMLIRVFGNNENIALYMKKHNLK